jgi:Glycosyltransferase family 87
VRRDTALALVGLAAAFGLTLWLNPWADQRVNDLFVYRSFAEAVLHGGLPYRDVFLEYPPLAAPAIALPGLAGTGEAAFRLAFAGWTFLLAAGLLLLCAGLAQRTDGDRRRAMLAIAAAPLFCGAMIRTHFDIAPVTLTLAALLLIVRGRPRLGLALLGAAVMTKVFPLVVAPVALAWLLGRGEKRAAVEGAAAMGLVVLALAGVAVAISPGGAEDAVRYQLDRPAQVESPPAMLMLALDRAGLGQARTVNGPRWDGLGHPISGELILAFELALVAAVGTLALRAARRPDPRTLVLASLAALAAFAALGKVLSPQFLVWTLPLGALALAWGELALASAVAAATLLTLAEFPSRYFDLVAREPLPVAIVAIRDAVLLLVVALALRALQLPGTRSWRIAVARPSGPASTSTAFSHGSSSEVSKRTLV